MFMLLLEKKCVKTTLNLLNFNFYSRPQYEAKYFSSMLCDEGCT
jgi:hypothetical protein